MRESESKSKKKSKAFSLGLFWEAWTSQICMLDNSLRRNYLSPNSRNQ